MQITLFEGPEAVDFRIQEPPHNAVAVIVDIKLGRIKVGRRPPNIDHIEGIGTESAENLTKLVIIPWENIWTIILLAKSEFDTP